MLYGVGSDMSQQQEPRGTSYTEKSPHKPTKANRTIQDSRQESSVETLKGQRTYKGLQIITSLLAAFLAIYHYIFDDSESD